MTIQFHVTYGTQAISVVRSHFLLFLRTWLVEVGLNRLGMNHMYLSLLKSADFLGLKSGAIKIFRLLVKRRVRISIFSRVGRIMLVGDGMRPLNQNPPAIDGIRRILMPAFIREFTSTSCLRGSRVEGARMRKIVKRREYSSVNRVAIIIIPYRVGFMPVVIVISSTRSLE